MPKLIPALREDLLREAVAILENEGYGELSMRMLAARCHVATGTVYNYFSSKDELVAQVILSDWKVAVQHMQESADRAETLPDGLVAICDVLRSFAEHHSPVWRQFTALGGSTGSFLQKYHPVLREQIAAMIRALIRRTAVDSLLPLDQLLAENVLACSLHPDLDTQILHLLAERLTAGIVSGGNHEQL